MSEPGPVPPPGGSNVGDDLGLGLQLPGSGTVDDRGRRRVHPITPLVHGVSAVPIGFVIFIAFGSNLIAGGDTRLFAVLALLLVVPVVVAAWSYLAWRNTWYWFDDDGDFRVDSGVLTRQQRRLQLSRLQSVDVTQPFVARIFSMAELSVEVAGAGDSRARLRYLSLADARALRAQVMARAAGLRHDTAEAPEVPLATVAANDLLVSLVLRSSTAFLLVATAALVAVTVMTQGAFGLLLALFTGGLPLFTVVGEFMRYFNFTASSSPDGLRLRFGMTKTQARTVPPGRVQAIEFVIGDHRIVRRRARFLVNERMVVRDGPRRYAVPPRMRQLNRNDQIVIAAELGAMLAANHLEQARVLAGALVIDPKLARVGATLGAHRRRLEPDQLRAAAREPLIATPR